MNEITQSLMKRIILIVAVLAGYHLAAEAQSHLSTGIGYYGENATHPGFVLELEHEPFLTEYFSLPNRLDFGFHSNPDYNAWIIDLHKGFRKYFSSGIFLEQSVGVGVSGVASSGLSAAAPTDSHARPYPRSTCDR